jgi:TonB family protein
MDETLTKKASAARKAEVHTSSSSASSSGQFLRSIGAIVWKDLAAELRSRELFSAMMVFSLLVIVIFNFALELDIGTRKTVTSGVLWVTFAFAGTLGLNRSLSMEKEQGCLDGLLLAPVDRTAIYFGKALSNLAFMLIVEAIVLPDGSVGDVRITRSLDQQFGLDKEAVKTVKQWRFRPGLRLGQPVPVLIEIAMSFTLR